MARRVNFGSEGGRHLGQQTGRQTPESGSAPKSGSPSSARAPAGGRTKVARPCRTRRRAPTVDDRKAAPLHGSRMYRPPPHVHGKEGVDGSSPSEGFRKPLQTLNFLAMTVAPLGRQRSHRAARAASERVTPSLSRRCSMRWNAFAQAKTPGPLRCWGQILGTIEGRSSEGRTSLRAQKGHLLAFCEAL